MKAALLTGKEKIEIRDIPIPEVNKGEALVKVAFTGICGTDLHLYRGDIPVDLPRILGHEISGEVADIKGDISSIVEGDRVVVEPNLWCGKCEYCKTGRKNLCRNKVRLGVDIDGGFAEYVKIKVDNLWKLDKSISFEEGALVEPLSVAVRAVNRAKVKINDSVVIIGAGPIGLLSLLLIKHMGATAVVIDVIEDRLKIARDLGADLTVNAKTENVTERIHTFFRDGVNSVIEASGASNVLEEALDLVKPAGKIVIAGLGGRSHITQSKIVRKEIEIAGSLIYVNEFSTSLYILKQRIIPVMRIVSNIIRLEDIQIGFDRLIARKDIKLLVTPTL